MKLNRYSAIYRNDNLEFTDVESVKGKLKDIKTYIRYQLASQCMSDLSFEELVYNGKMILDLLEESEEVNENKKVELYFNPMGSLEIRECE